MAAKKTAKKQAPSESSDPTSTHKGAIAALESAPKPTPRPSIDAIARAAYLNYRRRVEQGLPGDSHGDWVEAERQLQR